MLEQSFRDSKGAVEGQYVVPEGTDRAEGIVKKSGTNKLEPGK
jgi:hypothetical protein